MTKLIWRHIQYKIKAYSVILRIYRVFYRKVIILQIILSIGEIMVGISELSKKVASTTGTTQKKTAEIITEFLKETVESVNTGSKVNLADFGIFERKEQKERIARNPKTREEIKVPAKDKFVFRASSAIKYKD